MVIFFLLDTCSTNQTMKVFLSKCYFKFLPLTHLKVSRSKFFFDDKLRVICIWIHAEWKQLVI